MSINTGTIMKIRSQCSRLNKPLRFSIRHSDCDITMIKLLLCESKIYCFYGANQNQPYSYMYLNISCKVHTHYTLLSFSCTTPNFTNLLELCYFFFTFIMPSRAWWEPCGTWTAAYVGQSTTIHYSVHKSILSCTLRCIRGRSVRSLFNMLSEYVERFRYTKSVHCSAVVIYHTKYIKFGFKSDVI